MSQQRQLVHDWTYTVPSARDIGTKVNMVNDEETWKTEPKWCENIDAGQENMESIVDREHL